MGEVVYIARLRNGAVKIGTTKDLPTRIVTLKAELLASTPGGRDVERLLHVVFADDLIPTLGRECFAMSRRMASLVQRLGIPDGETPAERRRAVAQHREKQAAKAWAAERVHVNTAFVTTWIRIAELNTSQVVGRSRLTRWEFERIMERGAASPSQVRKLAEGLGCSPEAIAAELTGMFVPQRTPDPEQAA